MRYKYRLQKKEPFAIPNVLGNHNFPVHTYRWVDIAVSNDKEGLTNYMNVLQQQHQKNEYRIEDCLLTERKLR